MGVDRQLIEGQERLLRVLHCPHQCRVINVSKAKLEGLFVDELRWLQPTPGYLRVLKERVMTIWYDRKAAAHHDKADVERRVAALQQKLDRLEEAFIFAQSIDHASYERQRDKLRQELTLERIDLHTAEADELDVEGILAFAEQVLPNAADMWVHANLPQKQRFQQLFFPDGLEFDGQRIVRTAITFPPFNDLAPVANPSESLVALPGLSSNSVRLWLDRIEQLRRAG